MSMLPVREPFFPSLFLHLPSLNIARFNHFHGLHDNKLQVQHIFNNIFDPFRGKWDPFHVNNVEL